MNKHIFKAGDKVKENPELIGTSASIDEFLLGKEFEVEYIVKDINYQCNPNQSCDVQLLHLKGHMEHDYQGPWNSLWFIPVDKT